MKNEQRNPSTWLRAGWYMPLTMLGITVVDIACWAGIIAGGIALWKTF